MNTADSPSDLIAVAREILNPRCDPGAHIEYNQLEFTLIAVDERACYWRVEFRNRIIDTLISTAYTSACELAHYLNQLHHAVTIHGTDVEAIISALGDT